MQEAWVLMQEVTYTQGPRFLDGVNLDQDFKGGHPSISYRNIDDPVSDGSLGGPGYEPGQYNKDGSPL